MRVLPRVLILVSLVFAGMPQRESAQSPSPCSNHPGPSLAVFQALVREYHPEALHPTGGEEPVVVGLLLNNRCTVLHHATGHGSAKNMSIGEMLASIFPDLQLRDQPYITAGVGDANPESTVARGGPIVVWAIMK
jgi:hypothetical protein